jgi:hypothetical protein
MTDSPMERVLQEDACSFEFFQAVALLQLLGLPQRQPVGQFANPENEAVHFGVNNALAFPASQIQSIEAREQAPPQMTVNFMGLTGPTGVLPYCYSELILERLRAKDGALEAFWISSTTASFRFSTAPGKNTGFPPPTLAGTMSSLTISWISSDWVRVDCNTGRRCPTRPWSISRPCWGRKRVPPRLWKRF